MVGECLHHAMSNRQGVPSRGARNLDLLSGADRRCQVGMLVLDGISIGNIKLSAGEKFLEEVFPQGQAGRRCEVALGHPADGSH